MNIALYMDYGYYQDARTALSRLKAHGIDRVVTWIAHDVDCTSTLTEHELYAYVKDNGLTVAAALVPNDNLAYLSNTRYGRKDALKAYKQYVLTAVDNKVPLLVLDAAPLTDAYVDALNEICAYAAEQGVVIALRDAPDADIIGILSRMENLYYCLDTAICFKNGIDSLSRIASLKERLMFVLLSDLGHDDARYLPSYGNNDFAPILDAVKAAGYVGTVGIYASQAKGVADADAFLEAAKGILN